MVSFANLCRSLCRYSTRLSILFLLFLLAHAVDSPKASSRDHPDKNHLVRQEEKVDHRSGRSKQLKNQSTTFPLCPGSENKAFDLPTYVPNSGPQPSHWSRLGVQSKLKITVDNANVETFIRQCISISNTRRWKPPIATERKATPFRPSPAQLRVSSRS